MHIKEAHCPRCATVVVVDGHLFDVGSVKLRCPECVTYFLPAESPHSKTIREASNASVAVEIWEPEVVR